MNRTPDVQLVLNEWLAGDDDVAPDRVLDTVADRITRQPQRRAQRLPWRPQMRIQIKLAGAVAAGIVVAIVALSVISRSPTIGVPTPPPSAAPTASTVPSAAPTPSPRAARTLAAGGFSVPFHAALDAQWVIDANTPTAVTLRRGSLSIGLWSIADSRVRPPGTKAVSFDTMEPWPEDLSAWVQSLPLCTADPPRETRVDDRVAVLVDYRCRDLIETDPGATIEERAAATVAMANPGGFLAQYGTTQSINRLVEIRTGPSAGIVVVFNAPAGTFEVDAAAVDALLATLAFD